LVETASGLVLLGKADSGDAAVALVRRLKPDLVVMDVRMHGIGGIGATRAIKAMRCSTVVVLISSTHPDDLTHEARRCGADEVVWKGDLKPALLERIWRRHSSPDTRAHVS
jgi:DNA-binding NarL/FixJ family response regulator